MLLSAKQALHCLKCRSPDTFGYDVSAQISRSLLSRGVALTSDYSGLGSAEEALRHVALAIDEVVPGDSLEGGGVPATGCISCLRAGDISKPCQKLLLSGHAPETKPRCVMGDIVERAPEKFIKKIEAARRKHVRQVQTQLARGVAKVAAIQVGCNAFIKEAPACCVAGRLLSDVVF